MAKGALEKEQVIAKLKEVFPNMFEYEKSYRIPVGDVQIKIALSCAKENVEIGADVAVPGIEVEKEVPIATVEVAKQREPAQLTEEEQQKVKEALARLGF